MGGGPGRSPAGVMKEPACHLPAADAGKWDTARVSRIDWAGAARMAKARAAAGVELDDTDIEALRRDEAPTEAGANAIFTTTDYRQKVEVLHGT